MKNITLTVNGERRAVAVEARTQLAEVIRDHFQFTGTHLGCEQGVCGACTVVVDGTPVRSCIGYAHAFDGAQVLTVEGLREDPVAADLREAFIRHHALQCGFCTPGMLISARDVVLRRAAFNEAQIRQELSGNLCRCTGYVGIVEAVAEVGRKHIGELPDDGLPSGGEERWAVPANAPYAPFEPVLRAAEEQDSRPPLRATATVSSGVTELHRELTLAHRADEVWGLLSDLPRTCACIPGVSLTSLDGENFTGEAVVSFGPVSARFRGNGHRRMDAAARTGQIEAQASDGPGKTQLHAELSYALASVSDDAASRGCTLDVRIRYKLQGSLAQFNRAELVHAFADALLDGFVSNCSRSLQGQAIGESDKLGGFAMLWRGLKALLFRR